MKTKPFKIEIVGDKPEELRFKVTGIDGTETLFKPGATITAMQVVATACAVKTSPRKNAFEKFPAGRPRWLSEFQPWPCGKCGKEVDDAEPHDCRQPSIGPNGTPSYI